MPGRPAPFAATLLLGLLVAAPLMAQTSQARAFDEVITEAVVREHLEYLAGDDLNGRAAGSADGLRAAEYIAGRFKALGLAPADEAEGFLQTFQHQRRRVDRKGSALSFTAPGGEKIALAAGKDFVPFIFSAEGAVDAELVFVGYGITAPEYGYDDYAGLDVSGKVVLMLRYEPGEQDAESKFKGIEHTHHATFAAKLRNAEEHSAAGGIIFSGPLYHKKDGDELFGEKASAGRTGKIAMFQIAQSAAERLFAAVGKDLSKFQAAIDEKLQPQSFIMKGLHSQGRAAFRKDPVELRNVVGILRGSDEKLSAEVVVVGAHFDHIGRRDKDPEKPQGDVIYNGADDNASGTAGLLAVAQALSQAPERPKRTIIFCAFDGEEMGLVGSRHYVEHPSVPLERTVAMVNLDMIGRSRNGAVTVYGVGTAKEFPALVNRAAEGLDLKVQQGRSAMIPSDGLPFVSKRVPTLMFFTGLHSDYHRVTDEADRIGCDGLARIARAAARTVREIADAAERPKYAAGASGGFLQPKGPLMGVVVAAGDGSGLVLRRVSPGSGAEKAGLKAGDVLKSVDGREIVSPGELREIIRSHKVGDTIEVLLSRQGRDQTARVRLGGRGTAN